MSELAVRKKLSSDPSQIIPCHGHIIEQAAENRAVFGPAAVAAA